MPPLNPFKYLNRHDLKILSHGFFHPGYCPVCEHLTLFFRPCPYQADRREYYRCLWCRSTPRYRAFTIVLQRLFPNWRELTIHESSPGGALSEKLARECSRYEASNFFPDQPLGHLTAFGRNEDLQQQTYPDHSFDLVITLDVFEHLPFPERAFREIARTLKPGGAHLFTVPCDLTARTIRRASLSQNGELVHHLPPVYHGNPIDRNGSLVFRDWGRDMLEVIRTESGLSTDVTAIRRRWYGIEPVLNEIYVSRKI